MAVISSPLTSREGSQKDSNDPIDYRSQPCTSSKREFPCAPSHLSGHNPWMVQEAEGPRGGFVFQNCVCRSCPPLVSEQHEDAIGVVLWQLSCIRSDGEHATKGPSL